MVLQTTLILTQIVAVLYDRSDEDESSRLSHLLLTVQAGRMIQSLLRDTFTHSTRRALPSLEYVLETDAGETALTLGTTAYQESLLRPAVLAARTAMMVATYAGCIYLIAFHLQPVLKDAANVRDAQFGLHVDPWESFRANAVGGVVSALIEGADALTATVSRACAAWGGGVTVRVRPPEGFGRMTLAGLAADVRDHGGARVAINGAILDTERVIAVNRDFDRSQGPGFYGSIGALAITHSRGLIVELAQHDRALRAAIQPQQRDAKHEVPEPAGAGARAEIELADVHLFETRASGPDDAAPEDVETQRVLLHSLVPAAGGSRMSVASAMAAVPTAADASGADFVAPLPPVVAEEASDPLAERAPSAPVAAGASSPTPLAERGALPPAAGGGSA
ncbi:hypothetical protein WG922_05495 [Ramlibacter sp. AN1015]|uniref:hypothetical protein n=1 Tax=Ramlibacter sp. AN1015 TaxID=3133428 RepID=UPI0030BBBE1D